MMVLHQCLRELPRILDYFFADTVLNKGLLKQDIPAVFLVGKDISDRPNRPALLSSTSPRAKALNAERTKGDCLKSGWLGRVMGVPPPRGSLAAALLV